MEFRLMNAAGDCKSILGAYALLRSAVTEVNFGTITVNERPASERPTGGVIVPLELPNPGLAYYLGYLDELRQVAHESGKQLRFVIAGETPDEFTVLAHALRPSFLEVNLSPLVWANGNGHPIRPFNLPKAVEIMQAIGKAGVRWVAVRLPFISERDVLEKVVCTLAGFPFVAEVVVADMLPNVRSEHSANLVGYRGPKIKTFTMDFVYFLGEIRKLTPRDISIIAAGGIGAEGVDRVVDDVLEYAYLRADGAQINLDLACPNATWEDRARFFNQVMAGLKRERPALFGEGPQCVS